MELCKRKQIHLKDYDYSQNGMYFITICTHNKQYLFGDRNFKLTDKPTNQRLLIKKWLLELQNKYPHSVVQKYVIMPNHVHFILFISKTQPEISLHDIIKWFKTQTTNEYIKAVKENKAPKFDKHIWQRGYYEHIIRNENDYYDTWNYIDTNPIRWIEDCYY